MLGERLTPDGVAERIRAGIPGAEVQVADMTGTMDHYDVEVVSLAFEGLSLIKRHQLVYRALGAAMAGPVHALKLRTITPAER